MVYFFFKRPSGEKICYLMFDFSIRTFTVKSRTLTVKSWTLAYYLKISIKNSLFQANIGRFNYDFVVKMIYDFFADKFLGDT